MASNNLKNLHTEDFYCDFVLNNKIEVEKIFENERVLAYYHTKSSWTIHIVIVPKKHIAQLIEVEDFEIVKEIFTVLASIIKKRKLHEKNYKIVTNGGSFQDSKHLHFHLLSGKPILNE